MYKYQHTLQLFKKIFDKKKLHSFNLLSFGILILKYFKCFCRHLHAGTHKNGSNQESIY